MKATTVVVSILFCGVVMCASDAQRSSDNPQETAEEHLRRGLERYNEGDLDGTIAEMRAALRLNPKNADVHHNLGVALLNRGERDAAIAEFHAGLRLDPRTIDAHYHLGNLMRQRGT